MIVFPLLATRQVEAIRRDQSLVRALLDVNHQKDAIIDAILHTVHEEVEAHEQRVSAAQFYWMQADEVADAKYRQVH